MATLDAITQVLAYPLAQEATEGIRLLLEFVGEDPDREGLARTPERVLNSFKEMTAGYAMDPGQILTTRFSEACDEMVLVSGIEFFSLCEHHLLPFFGTATVAYLPARGRILGLSKLPRLVECFARRLQVQERLTSQVANSIQRYADPLGTGVIIRATHLCVACRGVQKRNTLMTTSSLLGKFREPEIRAEFLKLAEVK